MKLEMAEFARRFLQHVLPRGFARIRYYGMLANRNKQGFLAAGHLLLKSEPVQLDWPTTWQQRFLRLTCCVLNILPRGRSVIRGGRNPDRFPAKNKSRGRARANATWARVYTGHVRSVLGVVRAG
ncbi:transposase [bacterium]|nr:transposase [bacterium]